MDVYYVKEHEEGFDETFGDHERVNEHKKLIGGSTGIFEKTSGIYRRKEDAIAHAKLRVRLLFGNGSNCPFQTLEDHYAFLEHQGMTTVEVEETLEARGVEIRRHCRFYTVIVYKAQIMEGPPE